VDARQRIRADRSPKGAVRDEVHGLSLWLMLQVESTWCLRRCQCDRSAYSFAAGAPRPTP
jgi:hypothetical protein